MWKHLGKSWKRGNGATLRTQEVQTSEKQVSDFWESQMGRWCLSKWVGSYCPSSLSKSHPDIIDFLLMRILKCVENCQKTGTAFPLNSFATLWRTTMNNISWDLGFLKVVARKFLHPQTQHQMLVSTTALYWNKSLTWGLHSILKQHVASSLKELAWPHTRELCKVKKKIRRNRGKSQYCELPSWGRKDHSFEVCAAILHGFGKVTRGGRKWLVAKSCRMHLRGKNCTGSDRGISYKGPRDLWQRQAPTKLGKLLWRSKQFSCSWGLGGNGHAF